MNRETRPLTRKEIGELTLFDIRVMLEESPPKFDDSAGEPTFVSGDLNAIFAELCRRKEARKVRDPWNIQTPG